MFKKKPIVWENQETYDRSLRRLAEMEEILKRKEDERADLDALCMTIRGRLSTAKAELFEARTSVKVDPIDDKEGYDDREKAIKKAELDILKLEESLANTKAQISAIGAYQHDVELQREFVNALEDRRLAWEHENFSHKTSPDQKTARNTFLIGLAVPTIVEICGRYMKHVNVKLNIPRLFK